MLTHTGTILSQIIKCYTKDEFSHVSIALDKELKEMYSFGRLKANNPFIGGFVHEYINKGTFKRFYNTKTKIYSLVITDKEYENLKMNIKKIESEKENYKFNILGLFAAGFQRKIGKENSFYCAEFVKHIMEKSDISTNLPDIVKPENFKEINGIQQVYDGLLRKYSVKENKIGENIRNSLLVYKTKTCN